MQAMRGWVLHQYGRLLSDAGMRAFQGMLLLLPYRGDDVERLVMSENPGAKHKHCPPCGAS